MVYLLRNTSIFLPVPHGKHHQVGGPSISQLCFDMLKGSSKFHYPKYGEQKRKGADADDLPVEKRKCHNSYSTIDPLGNSSNLGLTSKSSMQLISHHESRNYDVSVSEVPKSTRTGTVMRKLESEGKQGSICITPRLGKRSRPFSWQRRSCKMQKQLTHEENSLNSHCNVLPTNTDCMRASSQPNATSLSYHAKELEIEVEEHVGELHSELWKQWKVLCKRNLLKCRIFKSAKPKSLAEPNVTLEKFCTCI